MNKLDDVKKYRTDNQFEEIIESMINGNYTQAEEMVVEYGFSPVDITTKIQNKILDGIWGEKFALDIYDSMLYVCWGAGRKYEREIG